MLFPKSGYNIESDYIRCLYHLILLLSCSQSQCCLYFIFYLFHWTQRLPHESKTLYCLWTTETSDVSSEPDYMIKRYHHCLVHTLDPHQSGLVAKFLFFLVAWTRCDSNRPVNLRPKGIWQVVVQRGLLPSSLRVSLLTFHWLWVV